ncbi:MAG: S1-like domain-containing RNA-binding protein [Spirochaetaceae bacterium]|jgi:predicted RNA-binding protein (virulence factor B family)|nr:S1-like domain-containing RNA-binding protein [Spirochaetaceae bacterium]
MLKIGNFNKLKLKKIEKKLAWLDGEGKDIEIPKYELPEEAKEGDEIRVFVFNNTQETLKATTMEPNAVVDEFAYMVVTSITDFGAFLEWGISNNLYLPERRQIKELKVGEKILVRVIMNFENNGVIADADWKRYIKDDQKETLKEGYRVPLIAMDTTSLGTTVIVDNRYLGLVYQSEVYKTPFIGQRMTGFVMKIRDDGKIDISFKKKGYDSVSDTKDVVLEALKDAGGFLPLHDKSDPQEIKNTLNMSKKLFKKSVGNLYAKGIIKITPEGIKLTKGK